MAKKKTSEREEPFITEDSTLAGIFITDKNLKVVPSIDERKRVYYAVYGDVERCLQDIYNNKKIGALEVLNAIKAARSMLWNLKGGRRMGAK
jgi:hypothetical protein